MFIHLFCTGPFWKPLLWERTLSKDDDDDDDDDDYYYYYYGYDNLVICASKKLNPVSCAAPEMIPNPEMIPKSTP